MSEYRTDHVEPVPLFYQPGYLTISDYDNEFRLYTLKFPNDEVKYGFYNSLIPITLGKNDADHPASMRSMILDLRKGDMNSFLTRLRALFAGIPYIEGQNHSYEQEWRNEVYLILALMGQNVKSEVHTAVGRADCVLETDQYIYIIEFKLDESTAKAVQQINEKGCASPYLLDSRKLLKAGISFSSEKRNIEDWIIRSWLERIRNKRKGDTASFPFAIS